MDKPHLGSKLKTRKPPIYKKMLIIVALVVVGFFLLVLILTPLRNWGAKKYINSGDEKLQAGQYLSAEIDYQKAGILTPFDPKIASRISLERDSETDISKLKDFFKETDFRAGLNNFKSVDDLTDPVELTKLARTFIERNEPQMAVVAARKATGAKADYRDGFLYLAIAYDRAARIGTIRQQSYDDLIQKSQSAYALAKEADPSYFAEFVAK